MEDDCEMDLIDVSIESNIIEQKFWSDAEEGLAPISLDEARYIGILSKSYECTNHRFLP